MRHVMLLILLLSCCSLTWANSNNQEQNNNSQSNMRYVENRHQALLNIADLFENTYLYPKRTELLVAKLRSQVKLIPQNGQRDLFEFSRQTERLIITSSQDKNIELVLSAQEQLIGGLGSQLDHKDKEVDVITAKLLEQHIGYLTVSGDHTSSQSLGILNHAMSKLADVEALIIDLTHAEQASIPLIQAMLSALLPHNLPIADAHLNQETFSLKTEPLSSQLDNRLEKIRSGRVPIYLLHSAFVSGPWELLGYTLKRLNKVTIIGQDTMGQNTLIKSVTVSDRLTLKVPFVRLTSPDTNDSWSDGISADISVDTESAQATAIRLANYYLTDNHTD